MVVSRIDGQLEIGRTVVLMQHAVVHMLTGPRNIAFLFSSLMSS